MKYCRGPQSSHFLSCFWLLICLIAPHTAVAASLATLVRKAGRLAGDIPINKIDDVAGELVSSGASHRLLRKAGISADDAIERGRAVRRLIREAVGDAEPAILKQIDELDQPAREVGLVLARGSRSVRQTIPDIAVRGRFVREGGAETLAALGLYDDLVEDAIRFDGALRAGQILVAPGGARVSLENFGNFFRTSGDRGHRFWTTCVRPHWKLWLGGTALATVMLAPDDYLDAAGDLTQQGIEKIGRLGGSALAGVLKGVVRASGEAVKRMTRETMATVWATFFRDIWGVLALLVLTLAGVLCLRSVRRKLWSLLARPIAGSKSIPRNLES